MGVPGNNRLSLGLTIQLAEYAKSNYTASGLDDGRFAEIAGKDLGFPVTRANVFSTREALGLKNNLREATAAKVAANGQAPMTKMDAVNILSELAGLQQELRELGKRIDTYFTVAR